MNDDASHSAETLCTLQDSLRRSFSQFEQLWGIFSLAALSCLYLPLFAFNRVICRDSSSLLVVAFRCFSLLCPLPLQNEGSEALF
jgi:hypothetical protein